MLELEEQLRRYGEAIGESLVSGHDGDETNVPGVERSRTGARRSHRRLMLVAASLLAAGAVTAAALTAVRSDRRGAPDVAASGTLAGAVFDAPTGTVLVFSDGIDGITALTSTLGWPPDV